MKVAVVHDWLTEAGGAELVLKEILSIYKEADVFTLVNYIDENNATFLRRHNVFTSFIQRLPGSRRFYRHYLPLMPLAIEQFDLSSYDLVISSSYCVAKGVLTGPDQLHICYCHSPVRYAWDLQHQYLNETNNSKGLKSIIIRYFLHKLRIWDTRTSFGVDVFLANSKFIAKRILKTYRRTAEVVYPPVATNEFILNTNKNEYYITCSRQVPYKRIDLIVEAFSKMPDKKLIVVGTGPENEKIRNLATANIELKGYLPFDELKELMSNAKCFVFAAEEDFGIVPVEAQACGTPVIAFGKGGSLETVVDNETGILFYEQTTESLVEAVHKFEEVEFDYNKIRLHAENFSIENFHNKFNFIVNKNINSPEC